MPLDTAVVGAGVVSDLHLSALTECPLTRLVGICDVDAERARKSAERYDTEAYDDLSELLAGRDLDWVHLCTPVQTHLELARQIIEAGVPVQIEKPVTETVAEAEELQRLAESRDVPVSVIHQHRFDPAMREAQQRIEDGDLGGLRGADLIYTGETWPDSANRGEWAFDLVGGEFEEGLPHPLYILLGVVGYPASPDEVRVQTTCYREYDRGFAYDGIHINYTNETGLPCSLTCLAGSAPQKLLMVHGEDRSLTVDFVSQTLIDVGRDFNGSPAAKVRNNVSRAVDRLTGTARNVARVASDRIAGDWESAKDLDAHCFQIDAEARALLNGEDLPVSIEEGKRTIELMECVREASQADKPLAVDA